MQEDYQEGGEPIVDHVTASLRNARECSELIEDYERVILRFWQGTARLLGNGGTGAVFRRSIGSISGDFDLLGKISVTEGGVDISELRHHIVDQGCDVAETALALSRSVEAIVATLTDLIGGTLTDLVLSNSSEK